jgi:hypothetical protein
VWQCAPDDFLAKNRSLTGKYVVMRILLAYVRVLGVRFCAAEGNGAGNGFWCSISRRGGPSIGHGCTHVHPKTVAKISN